jgi:hypothetical protein
VLHGIAFPVVSEWYQQRHASFTILLTRASTEVHPAPHRAASIQLTLDRYSGTGSLGGHNTADGMDETLGHQHCAYQ